MLPDHYFQVHELPSRKLWSLASNLNFLLAEIQEAINTFKYILLRNKINYRNFTLMMPPQHVTELASPVKESSLAEHT